MSLDRKLYAWLAEEDTGRAERLFAIYFAEAFPSVIRFLKRRTSRAEADLQDIAQEALVSFFERIGKERFQSAQRIEAAIAQLVPLPFGDWHVASVTRFREDVTTLKRNTVRVTMPPELSLELAAWKKWLNGLAEEIVSLQRRGCVLVIEAESRELRPQGVTVQLPRARVHFLESNPATAVGMDVVHVHRASVEALLEDLSDAALATQLNPAVSKCSAATVFVTKVATVVVHLPKLRVPTTSYLYDVANSLLLDAYKREAAKKRGGEGRGLAADDADNSASLSGADSRLDDLYALEIEEPSDLDSASPSPVAEFTTHIEQADLLQRFLAYLHRPVADAAAAFEVASARGKGEAQRQRLASLTQKFGRLMDVLCLCGQDFTQEEIAQALGITRNQVKYVIESVQAAYETFAVMTDTCLSSTRHEDRTHVDI